MSGSRTATWIIYFFGLVAKLPQITKNYFFFSLQEENYKKTLTNKPKHHSTGGEEVLDQKLNTF